VLAGIDDGADRIERLIGALLLFPWVEVSG
jgi:hypothetical protein